MAKLEGLKWESFWNTQLGCLKGSIDYFGKNMSDAWLFGGTGVAFILLMDEQGYGAGGSWYKGPMMNLCNNLGFTVNGVYGFQQDEDFPAKQQMSWENTVYAIDFGYPCYGYNLAMPEYYVVNGYEEGKYLFSGYGVDNWSGRNNQRVFMMTEEIKERLDVFGDQNYVLLEDPETLRLLSELAATNGYELKGPTYMGQFGGSREIMSKGGDSIVLQGYKPVPWDKLGTVHIGLLEMYWVEPGRSSEDKDVVKEALEFALEHAAGPAKWVNPPYKSGLEAYDYWINAVESDQPDVFALSYNGQCWAECRKYAAEFLLEASERIGGVAASMFVDAADTYREIHLHLQAATDLLPFEGKAADYYMQPERFKQIALHVREAKYAEQKGLKQLEQIVKVLKSQ